MITDEYRLLRRLGSGGMGEVWEAARIKDNDVLVPCAIKLLHAEFTVTGRERERFYEEARIATQLDHSRIVKVVDIGTGRDGRPFLVMERVDGIDLDSFLKRAESSALTPLEIDISTYIVGEILAALAYAHERTIGDSDAGIIHSDVTPGNIMISSSGEVKLTDFGIARFAAKAAPMSQAVGTPRYMSPEQLSGDPRRETDIYGLGVVLHELLDGKPFLDGCTLDQLRCRVLTGPAPELERREIPAWLDDLRRRMIATDRTDRPRAREARAVLIENCPRYAAAGERLKANYYARLIGRPRSGVTQVLARANKTQTLTRLSPTGEGSSGQISAVELPPSHREQEDDLEATERLPPPSPEAVEAHEPAAVAPAAKALALSGPPLVSVVTLASVGLVLFGIALASLVQMFRQPQAEPTVDDPPQVLAVEQAKRAAGSPEPAVSCPEPDPLPTEPAVPSEPEPPPTEAVIVAEPAPEPESPLVAAGTQTQVVGEVEPESEPESEPAAKEPPDPTPRPKPKPAVKVGVVFFVETKLNGKLKVGRKVIPIKNRSGYAELAPGSYKIRWQHAGSDEWQFHGKIKVADIAPDRYKVRLAGGKIVEVGEL